MSNYRISASLLSADFARLGEDAQKVLDAGADVLHFDAMDNHFVPNLTIGPPICAALRNYGIKADINVHLMATPIERLIIDFAKAGATTIMFHVEASEHVEESIDLIHKHGCKAGIAFNPETSISHDRYALPVKWWNYLHKIDSILVMSVQPGFSGQEFIPSSIDKIKSVKRMIVNNPEIRLSVDGGINLENISLVAKAGADTFVSGSTIFKSPDYADVIKKMHAEIKKAH